MRKKDLVVWKDAEEGSLTPRPSIQILKIRPHVTQKGFIVSDKIDAVDTHWVAGRTKPCIGVKHGCEGCGSGLEIRPKGYLAVQTDSTGKVSLLEITEGALDDNPALSAKSGLRGKWFEARRLGDSINSRLKVETYPNKVIVGPLSPEIDVKEVLCRIWFGKPKNYPRKAD
jgi:hypothetical protein